MKTLHILVATILFTTITTSSQITKGNWMIGGSASYSNTTSKFVDFNGNNIKNTSSSISFNPNAGYFIIDKLVAGSKIDISFSHYNNSPNSNFNSYLFGPFARYYFLKSNKNYNILAEASYKYGFNSGDSKIKTTGYNFKTGPVIFLNNSVGLEFLLEYNSLKYPSFGASNGLATTNSFQVGIGLQVHLEKK